MDADWLIAVPPFLISVALVLLPGLIVIAAGWSWRRPGTFFLAPAVSIAVIAVAAVLAPLVHLSWSLLPVAIVTGTAALVAFTIRGWAKPAVAESPGILVIFAAVGGLLLASVMLVFQLAYAFVGPQNISQTFDNIAHLNSVAYAVNTGNASAFNVGQTSSTPFYPNGWHSLTSLTIQLSGVTIPLGVNATNISIGAVAWPVSCLALAFAYFKNRPSAMVATAALSTAFGAFPLLLFSFGVLYPNLLAYALLPAGIATILELLQRQSAREGTQSSVLFLVVIAGISLSHPNAFLALYAIGAVLTLWTFGVKAARKQSARTWSVFGVLVVSVALIWVGLWRFAQTSWEMSRWGPWQSTAQAIGEAVTLSPRGYPITLGACLLLLLGMVAVARHPRASIAVAIPFGVAALLFILASGVTAGNAVREFFTNPWYSDSFRFAALLPVVGIPLGVLGALAVADAARSLAARISPPRWLLLSLSVVAALALFSVGVGPNVVAVARDTRAGYTMNAGSALLTTDEARLISRLEQTTPTDAVIAANPWTGASLAYALGGREVMEKHVFGQRTDDEVYLDAHLKDIDSDPRVCLALERTGITYVLDFGSRNVFNSPSSGTDRLGLDNLTPSASLVLVDSEGPDARLFRVEGCHS